MLLLDIVYIDLALWLESGLVSNKSLELNNEECEQHEATGQREAVEQTEEGGADAEHAERDAEPREYEHHRRHAKLVHARVLRLGSLQDMQYCTVYE